MERTHFDPICRQHHEGPNCEPPKSGFEDDPCYIKPCSNIEHDPPTHMVIPEGKIYRHVCPGCAKTVILRPPNVRLSQ